MPVTFWRIAPDIDQDVVSGWVTVSWGGVSRALRRSRIRSVVGQ
jgi:hypothetical protein